MVDKRILSIGDSVMTLVASVGAVPAKGQKNESTGDYSFLPDGRGVRFALAASLAGADSVIASKIGEDYFGVRIAKFLQQNNIRTHYLFEDKNESTPFSLILSEKDGSVRETFFPGVSSRLSRDDIEDSLLSAPDAVLLSSETPGALARYGARLFADKKIPLFYYATAGDKDIGLDSSSPVFALYLDSATARELTGISPYSPDNASRTAFRLGELFRASRIVIRLDGGFYLYDGKYTEFIEAYRHVSVDDDGADETFLANLALKYCESKDFSAAAHFAAAAWALVDSHRGGIETFVSREEIESFIAEQTETK